jgi:hypothetical protein
MLNHFHLVLWPKVGEDEAVSRMMKWLTLTHAQRWHAHRHTASSYRRNRSALRRWVQEFPDPNGRAFPEGVPLGDRFLRFYPKALLR